MNEAYSEMRFRAACAAMQGLMSTNDLMMLLSYGLKTPSYIATLSIEIADAFLKELGYTDKPQ
jgi:hypothetical protein